MNYPSIERALPRKKQGLLVHVFDKIDGSNLRFDWDRQRGWCSFGTRTHELSSTHPVFGQAMAIFANALGVELDETAKLLKWQTMTAFAEFWGPGSFAGEHDLGAPKQLALFDIAANRAGLLGPERFLELFGGLRDTPKYLGQHVWDDAFVSRVRSGGLPGVTFEGVVGKAGRGQGVVMVKAKTQAWVDAVLAKYGAERGRQIVES